ncbi:MAG: hydroxyacid dehydrogenase [Planctomycetota bacterium]|nr:hydroxyacid dehydrogenase [Planctomycetota bacterium]
MRSAIVVHPQFDCSWPFAADWLHGLWKKEGDVRFARLPWDDKRPAGAVVEEPGKVQRLVCLNVPFTEACLKKFTALEEAHVRVKADEPLAAALKERGIEVRRHTSEGFWGESVSEFGLALTLCGLRRIPQTHHNILTAHDDWHYGTPVEKMRPGMRGGQYGDDSRFTAGTICGKRIRVVGAGNIASRYAAACKFLGADVAAWDPFAPEPSFHRAGVRRELFLDRLPLDAEIFAPMVPLTPKTEGLVTARHLESLPKGCLVVLVTRANVCHMPTLRRRVLADELSLAADVFDVEPVPLDDPLLGRHNVVHTPAQRRAHRVRQPALRRDARRTVQAALTAGADSEGGRCLSN